MVFYGAIVNEPEIKLQTDEVHDYGWFVETDLSGLRLPPDMQVMLPAAFSWHKKRHAP